MRRFIVSRLYWRVLPVFMALAATAADETWKTKEISAWSDDEAKDVLADSPWVKSFTPALKQSQPDGYGQRGMGRGGIGMGGIGMGMPGMGGMGRRGGGGYPGGQPRRTDDGSGSSQPPKLTLRWESAVPVRAAELKVHDNDAPTLDDKHYAVAVYGVPDRMLNYVDAKKLADQLKKNAAIKRDGKKDFKPSGVEVLERPSGPVVVYMFPNSTEITKEDHRLEFDAKIGKLVLTQSFFVDDMVWQGKLAL